MKPLLTTLLFTTSLHADLTLTPPPANRGQADTAFAVFDSLDGLNLSDGTGDSSSDDSLNLDSANLNQSTNIPFPGGVKFTTFTDRRVYTFDAPSNWTISATPSISYNTATLRLHEIGGSQPGSNGQALPGSGLTDYTYTLNTLSPTTLTAEVFVFNEGTAAERYEYVTTVVWQLPSSTSTLDLNVLGYADAHDSIDSFILDLETVTPSTPPTPEITYSNSEITISWPLESTANLESCSDLSDPEDWQPVSTSPTTVQGRNTITLPLSSESSFFRLRS